MILPNQNCMNHTLYSFLILTLTASPLSVLAQRHKIYSPNIATLQAVADDKWQNMPLIQLGTNQVMNFAFDDLTHEYHRYMYRIEHCEADWTTSNEIFTSDYIDGFTEDNLISNAEESLNTNIMYTHYSFQIPNNSCQIKISGNYKVTVYDENENKTPILSFCFMVYESKMGVDMDVTSRTDHDINGCHQQVNVEVNFNNLRVNDPTTQIKTIILQNGRWDNAVYNPIPQYIMNDGLKWSHNNALIFNGGNEYRKFEILDVNHTTMGIEDIGWDGKNYNAYLWTDEARPSYVYDETANGAFYIRNSDNNNNDIQSDYILTHFKLKSPKINGEVYLNGTWTRNEFSPEYKLEYNETNKMYEGKVMLKQGYYSYQYLVLRPDGTTDIVPSEGNFYQTRNNYQALIYFKGISDRTDRLVGHQEVQIK